MDPLYRDLSQRRVGILPSIVCSVGSNRDQYDKPVTEDSEASSGSGKWCVLYSSTESKIWRALTRQLSHGSSNVTTTRWPIGR
jgi:hypothetical protein